MGAPRRDAVVVGSGVIGCSIALELARGGWGVTVVDKGGAPGCGSTSASSAMVRFTYDHVDEAALAWEAAARWRGWERHLGAVDPVGMARFVRTGLLVLDGELNDRERLLASLRALAIPYEELDASQIRARFPAVDPARLGPACRVEDPHFWDEPTGELAGFFQPDSGHVDDAMLAAHNLAHAAEQHGAVFRWHARVVQVLRDEGRATGVGLADGSLLPASVVVNAAGPWSLALNELAGVLDDFTTSTRAVEQEVVSLPAPSVLMVSVQFTQLTGVPTHAQFASITSLMVPGLLSLQASPGFGPSGQGSQTSPRPSTATRRAIRSATSIGSGRRTTPSTSPQSSRSRGLRQARPSAATSSRS